MRFAVLVVALVVPAAVCVGTDEAEHRPRARELGVPFDGEPGPLNAITDVDGVLVGHATLVSGGTRPDAARTGVTIILPNRRLAPVFAASFVLNGNGEATGLELVDEWGYLLSPIALTNTIDVGTVRNAIVRWSHANDGAVSTVNLPVVAETWDGTLNAIYEFHVRAEHVVRALESAGGGPVAEGAVGGGTGMVCFELKGGIGTASRIVGTGRDARHVVGTLVQTNFGKREELRIAGVPVGRHLRGLRPEIRAADRPPADGSIIVVVATDAPLLPHQLRRVAKRAALGLARCGSTASTHSGDIVIAFSTVAPEPANEDGLRRTSFLGETRIDAVFRATVESVEEAIVNALVAGETMVGRHGNRVHALPHDRLRAILREHGRLADAGALD
jgi:D-aminopeptidase